MLVLIIGNVLAFGYCLFHVKIKQVEFSFLLDNSGLLYLPKFCVDGQFCGQHNTVSHLENIAEQSLIYKGYSLEKSSRINCYGIWLVLRPLKEESTISGLTINKSTVNKPLLNGAQVKNVGTKKASNNLKRLVIYKDSLTKQDLSCLARIVNNL